MGYIAAMPDNANQLFENLKKIYDNKSHVKGVKINETTSHIEVDLDWAARHMGGAQDFFLPVKRGKLREAMELINSFMRGNHPPSEIDARHLFDLLDPMNK
jgi:hypothetical protein